MMTDTNSTSLSKSAIAQKLDHRKRPHHTRIHQDLSIFELQLLPSPKPEFDLELLFRPTPGKEPRSPQSPFETLEACVAEDKRREEALQKITLDKSLDSRSELDLVHLRECLDCSSLHAGRLDNISRASAFMMREIRLRFLGAILQFRSEHKNLPAAWISATHPMWRFSLHSGLQAPSESEVIRLFRSMLRIGGVMTAPGYLIAYLHTLFDPVTNGFRLESRGIAAGDKLKLFQRLSAALAEPKNTPLIADYIGKRLPFNDTIYIAVCPINHLHREILRMMPNMATVRLDPYHKLAPAGRAPEPFHSRYLMWAHSHRREPMVVMNGVGLKAVYLDPYLPEYDGASLCAVPNN